MFMRNNTQQHTVEGVGILPGRKFSRQVYQEPQRLERREQAKCEEPNKISFSL
jgi:hypothetical protein